MIFKLGSCSSMLGQYEQVIQNIIGFILEGLFYPDIWTSAALALKTLSRDCTKSMLDFTPQILSSCKVNSYYQHMKNETTQFKC